jgi:hypothetical protein
MAHPNINERRFFIANLLNRGVSIDLSVKKIVAKKFYCHVSAIYADCKHFSKNGWKWELKNGPEFHFEEELELHIQEIRLYSPQEFKRNLVEIPFDPRLIKYFSQYPEKLYALTPRQFEEFTAELLNQFGYRVQLSPKGPDGGVDIIAEIQGQIGAELMLVQCKRYESSKKVGRPIIQQLHSNVYDKNASSGLVITTSSFSRPALEYISQAKYRLRGADQETIKKWLTTLNKRQII